LLNETLQALNDGTLPMAEDAALAFNRQDQQLWQSIDGFRAMTQDLYRLGKVTTHHAVNDCYAMGLRPNTAQTWVNLAFSHPRMASRDFKWLMSGICDALAEHHCELIGGHSTEGMETHVALVVNGEGHARWPKQSAQIGDWLMLNKPIGSGLLLAGEMAGQAEPRDIEALWQTLLTSNKPFYDAIDALPVHAATDISGFGLVGHLLEMFTDTTRSAVIETSAVPLMNGALALSRMGIASTLMPQLMPLKRHCDVQHSDTALINCLFDPQTQGGLLIAVPEVIGMQIRQDGLAKKIGQVTAWQFQSVVLK
jgi:selenide,water dikinase